MPVHAGSSVDEAISLVMAALGPPSMVNKAVQSSSVGTCQPVGHSPLESVTAYQLYKRPYGSRLVASRM